MGDIPASRSGSSSSSRVSKDGEKGRTKVGKVSVKWNFSMANTLESGWCLAAFPHCSTFHTPFVPPPQHYIPPPPLPSLYPLPLPIYLTFNYFFPPFPIPDLPQSLSFPLSSPYPAFLTRLHLGPTNSITPLSLPPSIPPTNSLPSLLIPLSLPSNSSPHLPHPSLALPCACSPLPCPSPDDQVHQSASPWLQLSPLRDIPEDWEPQQNQRGMWDQHPADLL